MSDDDQMRRDIERGKVPRGGPAMNQPGGYDFQPVNATQTKSKREKIARLRNRLDNARTEKDLRDVIKGVLDLLSDEL